MSDALKIILGVVGNCGRNGGRFLFHLIDVVGAKTNYCSDPPQLIFHVLAKLVSRRGVIWPLKHPGATFHGIGENLVTRLLSNFVPVVLRYAVVERLRHRPAFCFSTPDALSYFVRNNLSARVCHST
jgi:hypothetical protein